MLALEGMMNAQRNQGQRSSQGNGASVVTEMKSRQAAKIRELGQSLIDAGFVTLDQQSEALGLARSTTWTIPWRIRWSCRLYQLVRVSEDDLILEPLTGRLPPWRRRTNLWRKATNPWAGAKRLRNRTANDGYSDETMCPMSRK